MRVLLQRVREARVEVDGRVVGAIGAPGLLALVGVGRDDTEADLEPMARKVLQLRIFADEAGKMNRSLVEVGGEVLAVSQFTLYADCRKGRRPSFVKAAEPETGRRLFDRWVEVLRREGARVETGEFGAMMDVHLVNDGPVSIWLDSDELFTSASPAAARID
jgi:D-aminoacyl-tRNA deacylase